MNGRCFIVISQNTLAVEKTWPQRISRPAVANKEMQLRKNNLLP
jgi:hypothetical protein